MKRILLICLFIGSPLTAFPSRAVAQDSINPYTIHQACNIILQNTDVYYCPFTPPDPTDTRDFLSNVSDILRDSNGIGDQYRQYLPYTHGKLLRDMHPSCGDTTKTLGETAIWQRLFSARRKADGSKSDIIVGRAVTTHYDSGIVTISKNEDVDFRASGTIKMENGFHVMPGAFFHAYIEPTWGNPVFSDEFDSGLSKWSVAHGRGSDYPMGIECSADSNMRDTLDPDAHDGHALDVMLRMDTNRYLCHEQDYILWDNCIDTDHAPLMIDTFLFTTAIARSCPWPYTSSGNPLGSPVYNHAPYGKYEVREKIPHVIHHTNCWGAGYGFEWDLNETNAGKMYEIDPSFMHKFRYGPAIGKFAKYHDTVIFISASADWSLVNNPEAIIIDNFPYVVQFFPGHGMDTVLANERTAHSSWPSSLANSTASYTFYYTKVSANIADALPWSVTTDGGGKWRIFSGAYHVKSGVSQYFSKDYQPTSVTLTIDHVPHQKTFACHWDHTRDTIWLDDTMSPSDIHSYTEPYGYHVTDLYEHHYGYPIAPIAFDADDTAASSYKYHTFAMEFLPNEVRFLVDSNVVRRLPDRLVPIGSPYYDWIAKLPRSLAGIHPVTMDIDKSPNDPYGRDTATEDWGDGKIHYSSITHAERKYFEDHGADCPGCKDVNGQHVAHTRIDYFKIWDVPADVKISGFPQ